LQPLQDSKSLASTRGATRDLTAAFLRFKNGTLDSDESESMAIINPKSRFQVRNTGFASFKSPNASMVNDKGALLPTSTKASSEDDRDSSELNNSTGVNSSGSI